MTDETTSLSRAGRPATGASGSSDLIHATSGMPGRESGLLFALPTYVYLVSIFGILAIGLIRFTTGSLPDYEAPLAWQAAWQAEGAQVLGLVLILRAVASGSVALTGSRRGVCARRSWAGDTPSS